MAGIDNASKYRSKEDEERLAKQKAKAPTNVKRAKELAKQYSNSHGFSNNFTVTRTIKNEKWHSGSTPTARETYARMYTVSNGDKRKMQELEQQYLQESAVRGSMFYNPYTQATNYKAIQGLADLGIDVPDKITDQWIDSMWQQYGRYSRETTTGYGPSAPTKSSTRENDIAYWVGTLLEDKDTTNLAEVQLGNMYKEVAYLTEKGYSDSEILKRVRADFGKKYNVLENMDTARLEGDAVRLNRKIDYMGDDTIYGMIWAARNGGGSGDYLADAAAYTLGWGNKYKPDPNSEAALDPSSADYNPYGNGGTMHELNMKYGVTNVDSAWLEANRGMLNDPEQADIWRSYAKGVENSDKAAQEMEAVNQWLVKQVESGAELGDIQDALKVAVENGDEIYYRDADGKRQAIKLTTLSKMEDERQLGSALALAYGVDFTLPNYMAKAADMVAERDGAAAIAESKKAAEETSRFEGWLQGAGAAVNRFLASFGIDGVGSYGAAIDPVLEAEHGAMTADDMLRNYASSELGIELTGDLTDNERAVVEDVLAKVDAATKLGATDEERNAANEGIAVLQQMIGQIASDPERRDNYKASEAYTSVYERQPEEPREGMVEMVAEPVAYTGEQAADPYAVAEAQEYDQMLQGGDWNFAAFEWAYQMSDNPIAVEAELVDGIMSIMGGEKGTKLGQSWWNKFQGLTANINKMVKPTGLSQGERDVHAANPELYDSRHAYGSQVYDALMNNQAALNEGAITDKEYVKNIVYISEVAEAIGEAADGARASDELASEVLGANNGRLQMVLDVVGERCSAGREAFQAVEAEVRAKVADIAVAYKRGETQDELEMGVVSAIKSMDISGAASEDIAYQDISDQLRDSLSMDNLLSSGMTFTTGNFDTDMMMDHATLQQSGALAYGQGVMLVAQDMLDEDMRFATACGMTLGEYYETYPEFARSSEQILAAAQSEYDTTWNEFGKTITGLTEANESLMADENPEVKGEDILTPGNLIGVIVDKWDRELGLSLAKSYDFLMYSYSDATEKENALRQQYGNDGEALRADYIETLKKEEQRLKGVYDTDASKGDMKFEDWVGQHDEAANYRQFKAQMDSALDIFSIGMTPGEVESKWSIADKSKTVANIDKLVAEHGSEGDKLVYEAGVSLLNSVTTMAATAAGGGGFIASMAATAKDYLSSGYDRFQRTGDLDSALWASLAEGTVNALIEKIGFDRYMPENIGGGNMLTKIAHSKYILANQNLFQIVRNPDAMSKVGRGVVAQLVKGFVDTGSEFLEEFSQGIVTALADNFAYDKPYLLSGEQLVGAAKEGLMAMATAPILSLGSGNKISFMDAAGNLLDAAKALQLPEHDGTIVNEAIEYQSAAMAIKSSSEALAQIEASSENAAKQQAAADLQAANAELAESQAELTAAQEAESAAAVALEDANVEMQDGGVFTEDLRKRMTAAADAIQKAKERVAKVKERVRAAAEKQAEAQQRHEEAKAKVQAMYDAVIEEAKAKARQIVTDLFFGGDSEAQQAASQKYLDACARLMDAKNRLRSAKADAEMYGRGTPRGDAAHDARGAALLEVDALTEEVAVAKAEVDAAYAEAHVGDIEAMQSEELTAAEQAAAQAAAEAESDPMSAKKQAKAELTQAQLRTVRAKQSMDEKRHGISKRLNDPRSDVREQAVTEWNALQAEADAAVAESEALQAEYDKTDAQKQLADAIEEAKSYTKEQVLFADEPGHVQAVRARNRLALAKADVEVENAYNALDNADAGTPEYDTALATYNTAVEAREDEIGRQMGTTGDTVREMLRKSPLGEQVMDAVRQGNQTRAANLIEQIMNSNPERRAELVKQAVKQRQPLQLREDAETGAKGKAGVTKAYSKAEGKRLTSDAKMQLRILDELAKDSGFEIVVKDSISTVKGAINGMLAKGGTIYIGLDAIEQGYLQAGTHEIVHGIRGRDEAAYNELKQAVTEVLSEQGLSVDQMVQDRINSYATAGRQLTEDGALEEIIAESAAQIWGSEANLKKFADEHPTAFKRVYDAFMQFWKKVQDISTRIAQRNDRKEITAMLSDDGAMQKVYDTFMKVAKEVEARQEQEAVELSDVETKFSLRTEEPPVKTGVAYKVFFEKDGKLYPPMVANPGGADTPVGVWLNADIGVAAPPSKTGRMQVKAGGKGTQGGSGSLAFRPGWHLGDVPKATQFNRLNPETGVKELFPANFVWAECEYAADVDYQEEAMSYGYTENGKFRHSYAGLPRLPENGYYRYRTNPNPDTVPWIITGAMKVNRILSHEEVDAILTEKGIEPTKWQAKETDAKFSLNLDKKEFAEFYRNIGSIQSGSGAQFERSMDGEYIFAIGNKMVYTDGEYDNPRINRVVTIDLDDETDIDVARQLVYDSEKGRFTYEQARRIAESVFGQEDVLRADYGVRGTAGGWTSGGTYRNSGKANRGNRGGSTYSLNESAQNREIANDLAGQLVNNTDNAMEIADILGRIGGNPAGVSQWRNVGAGFGDHRGPARTGETTTADRNPIEILSDLTSSIRVGYNPGSGMSNEGARVPRAVLGFYQHRARAIKTRTSEAGDLAIGLHEFGHAAQARLNGLHANQQLLNALPQGVRNAYDPADWDGEAIAEFVVDYIFSRDEAVRMAGLQFVQDFEDRLRQDRPLYRAVMDASHQTELWNNADTGSKIGSMMKEGNDPRRGQIGNWLQRTARAVETAVADMTAPADLVGRDFRQRALYSLHARQRADVSLTKFLIDPNGRNIGQSLAERLYHAGVTEADQKEVSRFALARHALDRLAQNKPVFDEHEFPESELRAYVADVQANHPNIVAGADALTSFWNDYMDAWWVGTGMIDQEAVDHMRQMYPHYVPTFRVVGKNFNQYGGGSARFQMRGAVEGGSSLEVIDPLNSIVRMTQQMTSTVTQNQLMRDFHTEWRRGGLGFIAEDVTQTMRRQRTNTAALEASLDAINATGVVDPALMDDAYAEMLNLQEQWYGTGQNYGANIVSGVDEYGNRFFYRIKDDGLYNLLSGTAGRSKDLGAILHVVRNFKNVFTKMTTGSNPLFAAKNAMRDIQASVNTGTHSLTYADGMVRWLGAMRDILTGNETYRDWQAMGGGEHTRLDAGIDGRPGGNVSRDLSRALFRGRETRGGEFRTRSTAAERLVNVFTWEKWNNAIENASRYVEYRYGQHDLTTDEGRMEAFMRSQDVTTNFGTRGASKFIQVANQVVPFMNATIQGLNKDINIVRDLFSHDAAVRRQAAPKAAKTVMNTALTAMLQYGLLKMFGGKDDDEDYALLNQEMRIGNLIIPIPEGAMQVLGDTIGFDKPYVRIPIAQGPLAQAMYAAALDIVSNVADYSPMEIELWSAVKSILSDSIPDGTVFQGLIDAANNRTWYGGEIESEYMRQYSEGNRYENDTPSLVIGLANMLHVSPAKLDYLFDQYTGFAGKLAMPFISRDRLNMDEDWSLGGAVKNLAYSVLKNYTIDPVSSNNLSASYSTAKDTISEIIADGKAGKPMFNVAYSADAYDALHAAEVLNKEFTALDKEISALWAEYNDIKDSNLDDGEKSRQMRDIRRNYIVPLQQEALALYEEYKLQYIDADPLALEIYGSLPYGIEHPSID